MLRSSCRLLEAIVMLCLHLSTMAPSRLSDAALSSNLPPSAQHKRTHACHCRQVLPCSTQSTATCTANASDCAPSLAALKARWSCICRWWQSSTAANPREQSQTAVPPACLPSPAAPTMQGELAAECGSSPLLLQCSDQHPDLDATMLELLAAADKLIVSINIHACNTADGRVLTWMPPSWSCWSQLMGSRARRTWPSWGRGHPWPSARCWVAGEPEIAWSALYLAHLGMGHRPGSGQRGDRM